MTADANLPLTGWLKAGDTDHATRVLIRRVEAYIVKNLPVAERLSYAIHLMIAGLVQAGELTQATTLLHKMQELCAVGQLPEGPTMRSYQTLLDGWQKSSDAKKNQHIAKLESRISEMRGD